MGKKHYTDEFRESAVKLVLEQVDQRKYIEQLERENRQLRMEREILKKATEFFAKEQS